MNCSLFCKILRILPKIDKVKAHTDRPLNKETDEHAQGLISRDDIDRLFVPRKEGGNGLANIEDCVDATIQNLEVYAKIDTRKINDSNNINII